MEKAIHGCRIRSLTSNEIAEQATSLAENRAAIANRWKKEGKLFSVRFEGTNVSRAFNLNMESLYRPSPRSSRSSVSRRPVGTSPTSFLHQTRTSAGASPWTY